MKIAWLGMMGIGALAAGLAGAHPAPEDCQGRPALYQAVESNQPFLTVPAARWTDTGMAPSSAPRLLPKRLDPLPVAFASSGDQCLGPVPIFSVMTEGQVGSTDSTHAMAKRLAPWLKDYSARTGLEACARMCQTPSGSVVARVVTLNSHVSCLAPADTCPAGTTPTAETIHSHPPQRVFLANAVDALGWDEPAIEGQWTFTGYPNQVSDPDRTQAPMWLVGTEGQLIWLDHPDGKEVLRP